MHCSDFTPLLAIQDGRLGEWIRECQEEGRQHESLCALKMTLWPYTMVN